MKQSLLNKMFTKEQYQNLAKIKKGTVQSARNFFLFPIKTLSPTSKLGLKSAINVVEKMDYAGLFNYIFQRRAA